MKDWLNPKNRVLQLLYDDRVGLGINELRSFGIHPKHLKPKVGYLHELLKEGLITMEKVKVKGGIKHLYKITEKGVVDYERRGKVKSFLNKAFKEYDSYVDKEKLELLGYIFGDMFNVAAELLEHGKKGSIKQFEDAIRKPLKEYANRDWLEVKDVIVRENRGLGKEYRHPEIEIKLRRLSIGFVIEDARMSWESNHWLNAHARYVLEKLGSDLDDIKKRNKEWLKKYEGKSENEIISIRRDEIEKRLKVYQAVSWSERQLPNTYFSIPDDYGMWCGDTD